MERMPEKTPREIMEHPFYIEQRGVIMRELNAGDPYKRYFPDRSVFKMSVLQRAEFINERNKWRKWLKSVGGTKHNAPFVLRSTKLQNME